MIPKLPELRVVSVDADTDGTGKFLVQKCVKFLSFFKRWETIGVFDTYTDAILFKTMYVPKDLFNNGR